LTAKEAADRDKLAKMRDDYKDAAAAVKQGASDVRALVADLLLEEVGQREVTVGARWQPRDVARAPASRRRRRPVVVAHSSRACRGRRPPSRSLGFDLRRLRRGSVRA